MRFIVNPSQITDASVTVPGDKSISHRALMLGTIAEGTTEVSGFLAGEDCLSTLAAMRALGVTVRQSDATEMSIDGVGLRGMHAPSQELDLGNSGTAMRLMTGLMCGQTFNCVMGGDESLNCRPMGRIIKPLSQMGAAIQGNDGKPPLTVRGSSALQAIHYQMPVASAQVKSAILLAGLYASGETIVTEPAVTRDHTERMLGAMGVEVTSASGRISMQGGQTLAACEVMVPADLSSAAFVILAAVLADNADIKILNVGVNSSRTGVIDILKAMGADISLENPQLLGKEPVADIRVRSSVLQGGKVGPGLVSLAIDEFPVLFVAAAAARGKTEFSGIGELRVKESDRISAMAEGMRILGIEVDETTDGAVVHGGRFDGGTVQSHGDHRVAMSLAVAASIASDTVIIDDVGSVDTSFPGFNGCMGAIGLDISSEESTK